MESSPNYVPGTSGGPESSQDAIPSPNKKGERERVGGFRECVGTEGESQSWNKEGWKP